AIDDARPGFDGVVERLEVGPNDRAEGIAVRRQRPTQERDPAAKLDDGSKERAVVAARRQGDRIEPVDLALDRFHLGEVAPDHDVDQTGQERPGIKTADLLLTLELFLELLDGEERAVADGD